MTSEFAAVFNSAKAVAERWATSSKGPFNLALIKVPQSCELISLNLNALGF